MPIKFSNSIVAFSIASIFLAIGVAAVFALDQSPEPEPQPTPTPLPQEEQDEVITKTLSSDSWETFDGEAEGLKRGITFLYPSEWENDGVACGGPGCAGVFDESDRNAKVWQPSEVLEKSPIDYPGIVGYISVRSSGSIYGQVTNFTISEERNVLVDGYEGIIIHRSVPLVNTSNRKEWWLILPNVEGSLGTNVTYELYMADIYTNSEEVFTKLINSIEIEPYETFKLKP